MVHALKNNYGRMFSFCVIRISEFSVPISLEIFLKYLKKQKRIQKPKRGFLSQLTQKS